MCYPPRPPRCSPMRHRRPSWPAAPLSPAAGSRASTVSPRRSAPAPASPGTNRTRLSSRAPSGSSAPATPPASPPNGSRPCPGWPTGSPPAAGSPTSAADTGRPPSFWPVPIRRGAATDITFTTPPPSQVARQGAGQAGRDGRIEFEPLDATSYPADGFDLICLLDTLHDLGDPAAALAHARKALVPHGAVLVVEPYAADDYAANLASPLAALSYAASTFQCTPAALAQPGGIALGAQAR